MQNDSQKVDVIIPIFNQVERVKETLATLLETTPLLDRLILVDDCSTDIETVDYLLDFADYHPNIDLILHGVNRRYSASVNHGVGLIQSRYFAILNSDLRLTPGWLESMLHVHTSVPDTAVVGCVQESPTGQLLHPGFFGHDGWAGLSECPYAVDWVTGCVWLVDRRAWDRLGPLRCDVDLVTGVDYRHFESDREWCARARANGYRVMMSPHKVIHYWRSSTPGNWTHT